MPYLTTDELRSSTASRSSSRSRRSAWTRPTTTTSPAGPGPAPTRAGEPRRVLALRAAAARARRRQQRRSRARPSSASRIDAAGPLRTVRLPGALPTPTASSRRRARRRRVGTTMVPQHDPRTTRSRRSARSPRDPWYQLYWFTDEGVTRDMIQRAAAAGLHGDRPDGRRAGQDSGARARCATRRTIPDGIVSANVPDVPLTIALEPDLEVARVAARRSSPDEDRAQGRS